MAFCKVSIKIRIKTSKGQRPYLNPVFDRSGRLRPLYAVVDGSTELRPEAYTLDEQARILAEANAEEQLILEFYWASGWRKKEVAHLFWRDIDFETGVVQLNNKPEWDWKIEDKVSRDVRQPDYLVAELKAAHEQRKSETLVFPTTNMFPARMNQHLKMLQELAKKAGVGGRVDLHKFRSTYASMLNQSGSTTLEEIAGRLGHSDPSITRNYLVRMNQNTEREARQSNETFKKLA